MRNCERRGRSQGSMLAPNLLPKAAPHDRPRLLPGLIVRLHRRAVEGLPPPTAPRKPGRPALLSESEVLTLAILAQWPPFRSERDFWRFATSHLRHLQPRMRSGPEKRDAGWRNTGRWLRPHRTTTPAGHGRRPTADGLPANARSSKG